MKTAMVEVACKACGHQIEVAEANLVAYPNSQAVANALGVKQILTCPRCDFGQTRPDPTQAELDSYYSSGKYWDEYKENKLLEAHQRVQAQVRLHTTLSLLSPRPELRVLDIGAGLGFLGDEFSSLAPRSKGTSFYYCAVEPDVPTAKRASERLKTLGFSSQVVKSVDEAGGGFHLIFLNHVLEHVHDPVTFLKGIRALLSESGALYIEVPHRDDRFKTDVFPHVLFFSATALHEVAKRAGFLVQFCEAFGVTERADRSLVQRFGYRVRRALLGRVFNLSAHRNWNRLSAWADRCLYRYRANPTGMWLRATLKN